MSSSATPKKLPTTRKGGRPIGTTAAESLAEARRRKEWALSALRELELARRRGQLVDRDAVVAEWSAILRQVRAGVLAVVGRLRERLPHLTAHDLVVIDEERQGRAHRAR